jgi:hypothetical protein
MRPLSCRTVNTISSTSALACKEWGCITDVILEGEQIIDIRKGGIREPGRAFGVTSDVFYLYPTLEHQRSELIKPAYRDRVERSIATAAAPGSVRIDGWASVVTHATITEPEALDEIDSKLIWTRDYAHARLNWKAKQPLWVLVLRAHRLIEPVTVSYRDSYGGCTSWISLDDDALPTDPRELPSEPALTDVAFAGRFANLPAWLRNAERSSECSNLGIS